MALSITTPVTTTSGISLASAYARITSTDPQSGTKIDSSFSVYTNEADFINGSAPVSIINPSDPQLKLAIPTSFSFPYNRQADGVDTLMFSHTGIQAALTAIGITSVIEGLN
tara:strand:- start:724 stop:1059 length:336 start_codon:yes stop_codon:yes gene_type:complete